MVASRALTSSRREGAHENPHTRRLPFMEREDRKNIREGGVLTTLTCEDNMALMARYPDKHFELAICDPPYGFRTEKVDLLNFRRVAEHGKKWNVAPDSTYFSELMRISKNQIVWGGNYFPELWVNGCRGFIYWHKGNPVPNFADGELAWTSFDMNAKQIDYRYYGNLQGKSSADPKIHINQKPVALYRWLLQNYAKKGDKILDTHLGSMSIAIACDMEGFDLTGCELDPEYYRDGIKRLETFRSQTTLF